ncbi:hypothetical protein [Bosea sp. CS1GBMeth4]|uniref:hypothetical protein n=1 Tax=Bosea sp. CS1GBMeth4 TaxID=1892849 RepID=UPI001648B6C3|nr:hypothetical protein [Bosea sp. CS1GBMeth4]
MPNKHDDHLTDTPAAFATAPRPGQPGAQEQRRAGPNPRSAHPTGPHAPYEADDPEGLAAGKHQRRDDAGEH